MTNLATYFGGVSVQDVYTPTMLEYDGSTGYYSSTSVTTSGNKCTVVLRFALETDTSSGFEWLFSMQGPTNHPRCYIVYQGTGAGANESNRLLITMDNSAGTIIGRIYAQENQFIDGEPHTMFVEIDGDAGTIQWVIDGQVIDDTTNPNRIAPTTGTLDTGALSDIGVGSTDTGGTLFPVKLGFVGYADVGGLDWRDFMTPTGMPIKQDTSSWASSGWKTQPLFWNEHGQMENNDGSGPNLTKTGNITLATGNVVRTGFPINYTESLFYTPAMMQYDGSTGYYSKAQNFTGNKFTVVFRFNRAAFSGSGDERIIGTYPTGGWRFLVRIFGDAYATTTRRQKLSLLVSNTSATTICQIFSSITVDDGEDHIAFISYDGDAGTAVMLIDGVDVLDTGNAEHTLTTGTLPTTGGVLEIGRQSTGYFSGQLGYLGYRDAYLTNWPDFMETDGSPKPLDETNWTAWGGSQPLFWNEHGDLVNNKGSAGAMTRNGTIVTTDEPVRYIGDPMFARLKMGDIHTYTLTNPGAESGSMTGWTSITGGMEARAFASTEGTPRTGDRYFAGGSNAYSASYQDVALVEDLITAEVIDAEEVYLLLEYYANCYNGNDIGEVVVTGFYNEDGDRLSYNPAVDAAPADTDLWEVRRLIVPIPAGARTARIQMSNTRADGTYCNGHIDDISVKASVGNPLKYCRPSEKAVWDYTGATFYSSGSVTKDVVVPPQTKAGDLLLILAVTRNCYVATPSGWTAFIEYNITGASPITPIADNDNLYGFYKIADGTVGETVGLALTDDGTDGVNVFVICIPNGAFPDNVAGQGGKISPSVDADAIGDLVFTVFLNAYDTTDRWTTKVPSGYSSLGHLNNTSAETHLAIGWKVATATGAQGTATWTSTIGAASNEHAFAFTVR